MERTEVEVHVTTDSTEEAERICRAVLEARLVACAQITAPISSMYWWRGEIESATELMMILKTRRDLVPDVVRTVREHHSYEVPDIIALPILDGDPEYLDWVREETRVS